MYYFFVLCLVTALGAQSVSGDESHKEETEKCDGVMVRDIFHKKHVVGKGLNRPYQLAFAHADHKIFFSYNTGKDDEDSFGIGCIVNNHTKHNATHSVENGFAIAIDNKDNIIYFGGSNGVFKQNLTHKESKVEHIVKDHNIWDMFFKKHLYFISYPSQHLYKYEATKSGGKAERQKHIHEKIYQFAIDSDDDIFITNETGLFMIKNGTEHRKHYEGPTVYRAIEIDNKGVAYFSGQNGIYVANKKNETLRKIAHVKNIFGIAFDNEDHIIYSDPHEIVKLITEKC